MFLVVRLTIPKSSMTNITVALPAGISTIGAAYFYQFCRAFCFRSGNFTGGTARVLRLVYQSKKLGPLSNAGTVAETLNSPSWA
jgi:hypothetical protein